MGAGQRVQIQDWNLFSKVVRTSGQKGRQQETGMAGAAWAKKSSNLKTHVLQDRCGIPTPKKE